MKQQHDIIEAKKGEYFYKYSQLLNAATVYLATDNEGSGKRIIDAIDKANAKLIVVAVNNFSEFMRLVNTCDVYFGNENNYPEGTTGYEIKKVCSQLLNQIKEQSK